MRRVNVGGMKFPSPCTLYCSLKKSNSSAVPRRDYVTRTEFEEHKSKFNALQEAFSRLTVIGPLPIAQTPMVGGMATMDPSSSHPSSSRDEKPFHDIRSFYSSALDQPTTFSADSDPSLSSPH